MEVYGEEVKKGRSPRGPEKTLDVIFNFENGLKSCARNELSRKTVRYKLT